MDFASQKILCIETSTPHGFIGYFEQGHCVEFEILAEQRKQAEMISPAIAKCIAAPRRIDAVVCALGPGSFVGARIGLATAKGIAMALSIPLWGVCSLALSLHNGTRARVVLCDGHRKEVFAMARTNEPSTSRGLRLHLENHTNELEKLLNKSERVTLTVAKAREDMLVREVLKYTQKQKLTVNTRLSHKAWENLFADANASRAFIKEDKDGTLIPNYMRGPQVFGKELAL